MRGGTARAESRWARGQTRLFKDERDGDARELARVDACGLDTMPYGAERGEALRTQKADMTNVEAVGCLGGAALEGVGGASDVLDAKGREWRAVWIVAQHVRDELVSVVREFRALPVAAPRVAVVRDDEVDAACRRGAIAAVDYGGLPRAATDIGARRLPLLQWRSQPSRLTSCL